MWKITLAYDGGPFAGWQVQPGLPTVQGTLAAALKRLTGETVLPQGSGRTDAGVHALAQVASCALAAPIPPASLQRALNRTLPAAVRVLRAEHAADGFHARHSAVRKTYEYRIFAPCEHAPDDISGRICSPQLAPFVWDCPWRLDLRSAQEAARRVLGEHDFSSFAASDPDAAERAARRELSQHPKYMPAVQKSAVRTIFRSDWTEENGLLIYRVTGSGFLHHMVRNLVGTFVEVARGRLQPEAIAMILAARNRAAAGPTAGARGLFLHSVEYTP